MDLDDVVLRLAIQVMRDGILFKKEFAYTGGLEVYVRTSRTTPETEEDGWQTLGWVKLKGRDGAPVKMTSIDSIYSLADKAGAKGWTVNWGAKWHPTLREYSCAASYPGLLTEGPEPKL